MTTPITAGPRAVLRQRRDAPHHHEPGRALKLTPAIFISPYATVSRATQLGTSTFADTGEVTGPVVALIIGAALILSAVLTTANTAVLERGDTRT